MYNKESTVTILTCKKNKIATKQIFVKENGDIEKRQFSAGTLFKHEARSTTCLTDLANILEELLDQPHKFVIRGAAKSSAGEIVRRKTNDPGAAFNPFPRPYVMLDIDKQECPAYFDAVNNPEEIVEWIIAGLPSPFKKASCYWRFSSSQNVPSKIGEKPQSTISAHLWFWLDRHISDKELKCFFKANPAKVDTALFSAVQPHFTARPIFHGMSDPLPIRSGILKRDCDVVFMPDIVVPKERESKPRTENEPVVTLENCSKAIDLLLPYYEKGSRDRFCGALAGALYRGGWSTENTANFIYELADAAGDEEINNRYSSALRICKSVDNNAPALGIPTLNDDIGVQNLEEILQLLGIGKPDINAAISNLHNNSGIDKIKQVMKLLTPFSAAEQKAYLGRIQNITKYPKTALNEFLKEAKEVANLKSPVDWPDTAMERFLNAEFERGRLLFRGDDCQYWCFNGRYWQSVSDDFLKNKLLNHARDAAEASEGRVSVVSVITGALTILSGRTHKENNPIHMHDNAPSVINCRNGELWFDEKGDVSFRPHLPESYLQHCLDVEYDPSATSPLFDKTVLEIFENSTDPKDMARHFMELAGYICQPWRKLAKIVFLYGQGRNGKSKLMTIIINVLGDKMVMADRISDIEGSVFKIGALDGKLMFFDDDVDDGTLLPDGFLKKISEEKLLTGQHKYKPPFEFMCRAVPVMLGNAYPALKDLSFGVRRRMMIIPFARQFKEDEVKNDLFDEIWEKEASGILNQFVAGFQRLKKRGEFVEPADCISAKQEWLSRSNVLPAFIQQCCEEDKSFSQSLGDFYAEFTHFCEENGTKNILSQLRLGYRLESLGYDVIESGGKKVVRGIRAITRVFKSPRT